MSGSKDNKDYKNEKCFFCRRAGGFCLKVEKHF
jgi:hypothetical protein